MSKLATTCNCMPSSEVLRPMIADALKKALATPKIRLAMKAAGLGGLSANEREALDWLAHQQRQQAARVEQTQVMVGMLGRINPDLAREQHAEVTLRSNRADAIRAANRPAASEHQMGDAMLAGRGGVVAYVQAQARGRR